MKFSIFVGAGALALAAPLQAGPVLIAKGSISGSSAGANADLSGLTGTLENGLPANILGGFGSGLAYAGGNTFLALPDRGPNATPYNSLVDDTVSYIARYQSVTLQLTPQAGGGLPFALTPTLTGTTLLYSPTPLIYGTGTGLGNRADGSLLGSGAPSSNTPFSFYFSGRSDNFGAGGSGNPANARFDPESIRVSNDGRSVFISDEYGPYVRQFDRTSGQLLRTYTLPANLDVATVSAHGKDEEANLIGRVDNKGMEGLAITPDGKTLVGIMQAPLLQDVTNAPKLLRIVTIDIATGTTQEFGYSLTTGTGVSEIVAVNNHQFLVDERDGKGLGDGSNAAVKSIFLIDTAGATDISGVVNATATGPNATAVVTKSATPFLDIVAALKANGLTAAQIPAKIEGLAFGQDVTLNGQLLHTLFVANDNDFVPGTAGANQFFVFGFQDSDLQGFTAQAIAAPVPEPATWLTMLLGFGLLGAALRRLGGGARRGTVGAARRGS
ncbi:esterase-like activity of phytase family protein [Sphingomonas sp.]|uniref:esterase-like activity of phytase family protein n=1 Tax=Sphingomonas sp. TaxID=28214 RepID=UPI003CC50487